MGWGSAWLGKPSCCVAGRWRLSCWREFPPCGHLPGLPIFGRSVVSREQVGRGGERRELGAEDGDGSQASSAVCFVRCLGNTECFVVDLFSKVGIWNLMCGVFANDVTEFGMFVGAGFNHC